ncbi:universal stress protein [Aliiroseovarius sp. YM-037]|uniref:universal stress protein n=1 Tax=Aliiroseovarius sp. YM-037 TaxID=3341728 RepID=UPI003A7FBF61
MYTNILVPVAPDHSHPTEEALAIARKLSGEGAKITALSVVDKIPDYVAQYLPAGQLEKTHRETVDALSEDVGSAGDVSTIVVTGHAGRTIVDFAQEHDVDLIVIASHSPGLQDYFLGSTAGRVVRHAQCAVHVLR